MPEILAALLPAAAEAGVGAAAETVGSAAVGGGADILGTLAGIGTGAAEVASGVGGSAIGGGADVLGNAATGLASGAGDIAGGVGASTSGGAGLDLGGLADAALPGNAQLTSGTGAPVPFSGVTSSVAGGPAAGLEGAVAGGAAPGAVPAAPTGSSPIDLTSLLGKASDKIMDNPLGLALAGGGLGYSIYKGQQDSAATKAIADQAAGIKKTAGDITGQGQSLVAHTEAGTLPPAIQQQLDQQVKDAKTKMISTYAANGMNTDPAKNSMLRQELAGIDKQALGLKGDLEKQLLASGATLINSGTALVGADNDLLKTLSGIDQQQTARIGSAIANFATALSGKSPGITLNLGNKTP